MNAWQSAVDQAIGREYSETGPGIIDDAAHRPMEALARARVGAR